MIGQAAVRAAEPDEAAAVAALVDAAYAKYVPRIGRKPAPMLVGYTDLIAKKAVYVLPGASGLRGVLVIMPDEEGMFLENIAVHPDAQGQGLGRQLMAFVEEAARARNLPAIHLYTNEAMTENLAFYTRLGYEETGRRTEDGYRRVFFRKQLTA